MLEASAPSATHGLHPPKTELAVPLTLRERAGVPRSMDVVTCGVPLPRGRVCPDDPWTADAGGAIRHACMTRPLALWEDGSVKWLLLSMLASCDANEDLQVLLLRRAADSSPPAVRAVALADRVEVDNCRAKFVLPARGDVLLSQVVVEGREQSGVELSAEVTDLRGRVHPMQLDEVDTVEAGPLRAQVTFRGRFVRLGLAVFGTWTFHPNAAAASLEITLHNPSRARHPQGCWDLGDPGSVFFREFALRLRRDRTPPARTLWCEDGQPEWTGEAAQVEIYQDSSGGEAFDSRNHVDAQGRIPIAFRGYRVTSDARERRGTRAQPIVALQDARGWMAAAVAEFWQQFPKAVCARDGEIRIGLFPAQSADGHELQGGEQKTHRVAVGFGQSREPDAATLIRLLSPLEVRYDAGWLSATEAIVNLPRPGAGMRMEWQAVCRDALEGERSFLAKREAIDEYGWRNYGDLWADHEEAYYTGQRPVISHYNNQYDGLQGFLLAYLLTGDARWWELADPLARHIIDIDIYHTQHDRAAYNGGLFWHTSHYVDAATCTHRSYSKASHPHGGGGLSNEHNYTSGLLLYYWVTGNPQALQAVVSLAEWVIAMDDGRRHILGMVQDCPTGFSTRTAHADYHRPGRGAGNSINALLDGWFATRRREFLDKAEELIRRTIHPSDEVADLGLVANAEFRWSYTVYLQTLLRILTSAREIEFSSDLVAYVRDSLLHYARWMTANERFYLDEPEKLEYPTETWAAQELRKGNVLLGAAAYADEDEAALFRHRAEAIYERSWETLLRMPTRTYTRPTILALQLGLAEAALRCQPPGPVLTPTTRLAGKSASAPFIPQKAAFFRSLKSPVGVLGMGLRLLRFWRWREPLRATWLAQTLRRARHRWLP